MGESVYNYIIHELNTALNGLAKITICYIMGLLSFGGPEKLSYFT